MADPIETFFQPNKWYSITLSPNDKSQFHNQVNRLNKFRNKIYESVLNQDIYLIIELSEPRGFIKHGTTGPRLHCHGFIKWRNKQELLKFLLFTYYSLLRFTHVDIDTINDYTIWWDYIHKQHIIPSKVKRISNYADFKQDVYDKLIK